MLCQHTDNLGNNNNINYLQNVIINSNIALSQYTVIIGLLLESI